MPEPYYLAPSWNNPPSGPTTMTQVIPSYLYQEYADDPTLPAFIISYNQLAQEYINTINDLNLPNYTILSGGLLDWVANGLYGYPRPSLSYLTVTTQGRLNTVQYNTLEYNGFVTIENDIVDNVNDDFFKRLLTWHLYKGDGKYFTIRWLKRRVMRFLIGTNGISPDIDQTYQISVTFEAGNIATIRFIDSLTAIVSGALFNLEEFNTTQFNALHIVTTMLTPLPNRQIFHDAVLSGSLELPFQYTWNVIV